MSKTSEIEKLTGLYDDSVKFRDTLKTQIRDL